MSINDTKNQVNLYPITILLMVVVTTLLLNLLSVTNRAIDFIDEGFYLNWISNPWIYSFFTSQFGFVYNPLYKILHGDLILLRQANILLNFFLSFLLFWIPISQSSLHKNSRLDIFIKLSLTGAISSSALLILIRTDYWIPTPSYNTLTFQGALFFSIAIVSELYRKNTSIWGNNLLIALGGWLVFMGKPPSAALLAFGWLIYQFFQFSKKNAVVNILTASGYSLVFLFAGALLISGSLGDYYLALKEGLYTTQLFDAGHAKSFLDLFQFDKLYFTARAKLVLLTISGLVFFSAGLVFKLDEKFIGYTFNLLTSSMLCIAIFSSLNIWQPVFLTFRFYLLTFFVVTLTILIKVATKNKSNVNLILHNHIVPAILIALLPYILSIGSNNNYWQLSSSAGLFWMLALIILLNVKSQLSVFNKYIYIYLATVTIFFVTLIVKTSLLVPYNQNTPLNKVRYPIQITNTHEKLMVRKDMHLYISGLYQNAKEMGFIKNTPMIDLTGHYGTSLYLINAKSIGLPSMFGGYNGSNKYAAFALYKTSCSDLARAWLLIKKDVYRQISADVLEKSAGININGNYNYSKPFKSFINEPSLKWGNATTKKYEHYLLKPVDTEKQTQDCLAYRKANPNLFQ